MESIQFESSRVGNGTLRTERPALEAEISNMIAEGGPAPPEGDTAALERLAAEGPKTRLAAAGTLIGNRVLGSAGAAELGYIEEIMLDLQSGRIAYAVLSFGGFPAIPNKRFPVPWNALETDQGDFILNMDRRTLEGAPGFDKDNWPDMADPAFGRLIHKHYGITPYWQTDAVNSSGLRH
jgi:hypothetical protein